MKIKRIILISLLSLMSLVSCNKGPLMNNGRDGYTVIWQNYDGTILEIDRNVKAETMPNYDGEEPLKEGNDQYSYIFTSWDQELVKVTKNITYTAVYKASLNTYKVTWVDKDGTILEQDSNVPYGIMPSYEGETPSEGVSHDNSHFFSGWSPLIKKVTGDITYTATYSKISDNNVNGGQEVKFLNNGHVLYGYYPQTHVDDSSLINSLNSVTTFEENGWVKYNQEYYTKINAKVFNNEKYQFDDGIDIVNNAEYWFKCEPIEWNILSLDDGNYTLLSTVLLDVKQYYNNYEKREIDSLTIFSNNYNYSDIRSWLNEDFYDTAFVNKSYFKDNILDKVSLLSYDDYLNSGFGFERENDASLSRGCKTTDYTRAKGAWCNIKRDLGTDSLYNSVYWTKTPSNEFDYCSYAVTSGGYLGQYAVDSLSHCVRPCIIISLN